MYKPSAAMFFVLSLLPAKNIKAMYAIIALGAEENKCVYAVNCYKYKIIRKSTI